MNKTITALTAIKIVGITAGTSNALEMNPETSKIGAPMQKFFASRMQAQILAASF
jgi:hypothetical protein